MSARRMVKIDVGGRLAEVLVTEVTPGRWSWVVRVAGEPSLSSRVPCPTGQSAMTAAMSHVRTMSSAQADLA